MRWFDEQGVVHDAMPAGRRAVIGSPAKVREGIVRVAEEYGANEVMIVTITYDHAARRRSCELIASSYDESRTTFWLLHGTQSSYITRPNPPLLRPAS